MTKLLTLKILLILLMSFFSTAAIAHDIEVKNADGVTIYYNWVNNKTELEVSYRGENSGSYEEEYSGNLAIPETVTYNGKTYSVSSIGDYSFWGCDGLTSITIPNSVTSISDNSFFHCVNLVSLIVESGNPVYDSRNNCNAIIKSASNRLIVGCKNTIIPNTIKIIGDGAFSGCSSLQSITIPNSVTVIDDDAFLGCSNLSSIEIPNSVTSIGRLTFERCDNLKNVLLSNNLVYIDECAFANCKSLKSIVIPSSVETIRPDVFVGCLSLESIIVDDNNAVYDSREKCNAIIETSSNTLIVGCMNSIIPNSVTSIGYRAFFGSGLASVTIPNSILSIGSEAFHGCVSLRSIVSEIETPFAIGESVFETGQDLIYEDATLTVPAGTKAKYQVTDGWKRFRKIVEVAGTEIEFSIDGVTYHGSSSDKTALVKSVDTSLPTVEIPESVSYEGAHYQVSGIDEHAFDGSTMAALVWNVDVSLPSNAFSNASMGSNFLLYVKSGSYAPSSVKNVVVNGTAQSIVLSDDGGQFCCPQSFMAEKISYTHNYSMETGGDGKGWETIALPFNVQKISHGTRGEIVPFASYNGGSSQKPFWLASMSSSGFSRSSSIQANQPYIIAMPNSNKYQNDYNLAGDVTFSAENVNVPATPTFSGTFLPAYSIVAKSASVYALNVNNRYVTYSSNYDAGSRFISNLRDVRPFEAYISSSSSTRGVIEVDFDDNKTGLANILFSTDDSREVTIYTISGRKVGTSQKGRLDETIEQLPKGVYIVNGRKIVK